MALLKPPEIEFGEASKVFSQEGSGLQSDLLYVEGRAGVKIFLNPVNLDSFGFDSHDAGGVGENYVDELRIAVLFDVEDAKVVHACCEQC